jgi:MFS family permease
MDGGQTRPLILDQNQRSIVLLYAARAARGFGDGFAVIILPAYLAEIGFDAFQVGLVATAALLGTAAATLLIGHLGARHDIRNLLLLGTAFMIASGIAFPNAQHIVLVAVIAFFGTMNPSTGDLGMLVPLEHAMIARSVADRERTAAFARYSLLGALATAAGALVAAVPDLLGTIGIGRLTALRMLFYGYAVLGVLSALLYMRLPHAEMKAQAPQAALGPSRGIVYKLAALFSVDAFAGGFAVQSLIALWLFDRFDLSLTAASLFFFWANVLAAFSYPVAARLAKRFGLVNTMVYTHIPSSLCLIVAAFAPNLIVVLALLLVRAALSQMDVPTRTSYVMAVVTPEERPAAASVTAVPRTLASAISPAIAGALLSTTVTGVPLVICGALKIAYDVALLYSFRHIKPPEERG